MRDKNPVNIIIIGVVLFLIGHFAPNGIMLSNIAEIIGIINLLTTTCEGLGLGLVIGGAILFIKNKKK